MEWHTKHNETVNMYPEVYKDHTWYVLSNECVRKLYDLESLYEININYRAIFSMIYIFIIELCTCHQIIKT